MKGNGLRQTPRRKAAGSAEVDHLVTRAGLRIESAQGPRERFDREHRNRDLLAVVVVGDAQRPHGIEREGHGNGPRGGVPVGRGQQDGRMAVALAEQCRAVEPVEKVERPDGVVEDVAARRVDGVDRYLGAGLVLPVAAPAV